MEASPTVPHFQYRPEIDELRAIAVVAVVLHHFKLLNGRFAGVDVFFVISGFLIISLRLRDLLPTSSESECFTSAAAAG